jgi:hypothetical protein
VEHQWHTHLNAENYDVCGFVAAGSDGDDDGYDGGGDESQEDALKPIALLHKCEYWM